MLEVDHLMIGLHKRHAHRSEPCEIPNSLFPSSSGHVLHPWLAVHSPSLPYKGTRCKVMKVRKKIPVQGMQCAVRGSNRRTIYVAMVAGHLDNGFDSQVVKLGTRLVDATLELHRNVMNNFLPSAVKFHYQFNLRELSNITEVIHALCLAAFSSVSVSLVPLVSTSFFCLSLRYMCALCRVHVCVGGGAVL
jgi:hypothetical protein